jgi:hypothetical protein
VPEQAGPRVTGGIAARNPLHDVTENLVSVRGKAGHKLFQCPPAILRGGRGAEQCDLLRAAVPPGGLDTQAVQAEPEPDLDVAGRPHDGTLVLPPVGGTGVAPDGEILIPGIGIRKIVQQIDHRPPHTLLAVPSNPLSRLARRLAAQLQQHRVRLLRPAAETRLHVGMLPRHRSVRGLDQGTGGHRMLKLWDVLARCQ